MVTVKVRSKLVVALVDECHDRETPSCSASETVSGIQTQGNIF